MLLSGVLALVQAVLHGFRLLGWYHPNIWEKPLLWVLYLAYGWLIVGFLLKFLNLGAGIAPVWLHAFAYGGIAMMTAGMMMGLALGHTGRNVAEPPAILSIIFLLLFSGAFIPRTEHLAGAGVLRHVDSKRTIVVDCRFCAVCMAICSYADQTPYRRTLWLKRSFVQ